MVDPFFKDQFLVSSPTPRYAAVLQALDPHVAATKVGGAAHTRVLQCRQRDCSRLCANQGGAAHVAAAFSFLGGFGAALPYLCQVLIATLQRQPGPGDELCSHSRVECVQILLNTPLFQGIAHPPTSAALAAGLPAPSCGAPVRRNVPELC